MSIVLFMNLVTIAALWVVVLDMTDFMDTIKGWISAILTKGKSHNSDYRLKPVDCSLCMTWWTCLVYLLVTGNVTLATLLAALTLAWFTPVIKDVFMLLGDAITTIIRKLHEKL